MKKYAFLFAIVLAAFLFAWAQDPPQIQQNTTILAPPLVRVTVATPNGGEQVLRGAQQTIQWSKIGDIGRPTIEIKKDGAVVRSYAAVTPVGPVAGKWRWTWDVPATLATGHDYKVRVVSENGRVADESNANFHVVASKIEVYMPRAGERYRRGSTMSIHFRCFNVTQNLRIYQINFANYPIAVNVPPDQGIVEWRTVGTSPDGVVLFPSGYIVVAAMDGSVYGYSHGYELYD